MMVRQGDVLLVCIADEELGDEVSREGGRVVLAHGEVSGHTHAVDAPEAALFKGRDNPDKRYLRLLAPASVVHEEHEPIPLPAGLYRVLRQREWTDEMEPVPVSD